MAEIPRQADITVARIGLGLVAQDDRAAVGAGVVDENRFRRTVELRHQYVEAAQQHRQHRFLVKNGNHDAVANVAGVGRHRTITQPNGATLVHEWLRKPLRLCCRSKSGAAISWVHFDISPKGGVKAKSIASALVWRT